MFMAIIVAMFMGLMVSADEIIRDRKILERESFLRLSRLSYLNSKILVLFLISAIQTFLFVIVGNTILEIKGMLFQYWTVLFTVSCLANVIGLNISSGLNSVVNAILVIPVIVIPQLLFSGVMINFDRLNSFFQNPSFVPVIGEMMTSRWAYEAMTVHQFKGNKFTREFFKIEQENKNALYLEEYVSAIQVKLDDIDFNYEKAGKKVLQESKGDLALVRNELDKLTSFNIVSSFGNIENFQPDKYNETVYRVASDSLKKNQEHFRAIKWNASRQKDAKSEALIKNWGGGKVGKETYVQMEKDYTNKRLEELLTNKGQFVVEWNNQLVRKASPIYMEPRSHIGRAHFFAPVKKLGSLSIETYWFNLIIIWLSFFIYYLALVNDILRKFTNWNRIRRLRKRR